LRTKVGRGRRERLQGLNSSHRKEKVEVSKRKDAGDAQVKRWKAMSTMSNSRRGRNLLRNVQRKGKTNCGERNARGINIGSLFGWGRKEYHWDQGVL